jgi:hypothetical protein
MLRLVHRPVQNGDTNAGIATTLGFQERQERLLGINIKFATISKAFREMPRTMESSSQVLQTSGLDYSSRLSLFVPASRLAQAT